MKHQSLMGIVLAVLGTATLSGQSVPSSAASDGLDLLQRVAQHYANAKSCHIEAVEERESHNEFYRNWEKTVMTVAEAPGNRFRYEGDSRDGGSVLVSDGKTLWTYRLNEHRYTQRPFSETPPKTKFIARPEYAMARAERLRKELADLPKHLKSAIRLDDATLSINGRDFVCYVVRIQNHDRKSPRPDGSFDKRIWIDKNSETIVKTAEHTSANALVSGSVDILFEKEVTTVFSVADFDRPVPESVFSFSPPSNAKLIGNFPDGGKFGPDLSGEQAPALSLKSSEGKAVSLDSFRGKPVLLDIWATWCPSCVEGLEQIAQVYKEAQSKGLVFLSVDEDEEEKTATDFLAKKNFGWPNFHDDWQIGKALGSSAVPRTILIDKQGTIVYDTTAGSGDELRAAVAKLGPEYASLAPKPQPVLCSAPTDTNSQHP